MADRNRVAFVVLATLFLLGLIPPPSPRAPAASVAPRADAPLSAALLFGGRLDLNRASVADLAALPGIGPARARRIADHRSRHGPFEALEELDAVPGIGPKTLLRLRPFVTCEK